uniref:Uncharacterized protein n=1 Tax=Kalanchoe fedtschenkoi TaxID=63787 RepID=A0A7N0TZT9_KALFE
MSSMSWESADPSAARGLAMTGNSRPEKFASACSRRICLGMSTLSSPSWETAWSMVVRVRRRETAWGWSTTETAGLVAEKSSSWRVQSSSPWSLWMTQWKGGGG